MHTGPCTHLKPNTHALTCSHTSLQTPRASSSNEGGPFASGIEHGPQDSAHEASAPPPATVAGRRNLRNFQSRPPPTDFETWKQAEVALQSGLTVKQLVTREFERNFGPDSVQCVPPLLASLLTVASRSSCTGSAAC
jgi:hypothetical protein